MRSFDQELRLRHTAIDRRGEARALTSLGNALHAVGQFREAEAMHRQRLRVALEMQDEAGQGRAHAGIGAACQATGRYPEAVGHHQRHLAVRSPRRACVRRAALSLMGVRTLWLQFAQAHGQTQEVASAFANLSAAFSALGLHQRLQAQHDTAPKPAPDAVGGGAVRVRGRCGCACVVSRCLQDKLATTQELLRAQLRSAGGTRGGASGAQRPALLLGQGNRVRAAAAAEEEGAADAESSSATSDTDTDWAAAPAAPRALPAHSPLLRTTLPAYLACHGVLPVLPRERLLLALSMHQKQLLAASQAGSRVDMGRAHGNVACVHLLLRDAGTALQHAQLDCEAAREVGDGAGLCAALMNTVRCPSRARRAARTHVPRLTQGHAHVLLDQHAEARRVLLEALRLARQRQEAALEARAAAALGRAHLAAGQLRLAGEHFSRYVKFVEAGEDRFALPRACLFLADAQTGLLALHAAGTSAVAATAQGLAALGRFVLHRLRLQRDLLAADDGPVTSALAALLHDAGAGEAEADAATAAAAAGDSAAWLYERARAEAAVQADAECEGRALEGQAQVVALRGGAQEAVVLLELARAAFVRAGLVDGQARVLELHAQVLASAQRFGDAVQLLQRTLGEPIATMAGPMGRLCTALSSVYRAWYASMIRTDPRDGRRALGEAASPPRPVVVEETVRLRELAVEGDDAAAPALGMGLAV